MLQGLTFPVYRYFKAQLIAIEEYWRKTTLNIHGKTPERTFLRLATVLVMLVAWVSNFFGLFTQYFNCKISVWSELLKNRPVLAFRFYKTILEIEQISISTLFRLVKDILMTCNIKLSILLKFQWDWPWKFK